MAGVRTLTVADDDDGLRLDRWFRRHFPLVTHGRLEKWLRTGQVRVDGGRAKAATRLAAGQTLRLPPFDDDAPPPPVPALPRSIGDRDAEALRGRVLYRDAEALVIDKPAGLAVQGGTRVARHLDGMLDALRFEAEQRPRLVHRLDRDTSGVLVLGRSAAAAARLAEAFRAKTARKVYWALVVGVPRLPAGEIKAALAKLGGPGGEKVVPVSGQPGEPEGRRAVTRYRIVDRAGNRAAWLALEPETGRTHQIRVHCAAVLGTPIVGDGKYGGAGAFSLGDGLAAGLHLHARAIRLPLAGGRVLEIAAPLPTALEASWRFLGFDPRPDRPDFIEIS